MKIEHIRPGRETNSSSSHSFVKLPNRMAIPRGETIHGGDFGWEWRVLDDPEELMGYLLMQALRTMGGNISGILSEFDVKLSVTEYDYIDHASRFDLNGTDYVVGSFMEDLITELYSEGTTVMTGNDNDDMPLDMMKFRAPNKWDILFGACYVTRPRNDTYVILAQHGCRAWEEKKRSLHGNWTKVRMKTDCEDMGHVYPESIDVKITERCYNDCPFCYEDASKDGKHCDYEDFREMIRGIGGYTAEIAIGGGNSLLHPHLFNMLEYAKANHVLPAITVRDTDMVKFLEEVELTPRIKDVFRNVAIGLSFSDTDAIRKVFELSGYSFRYTVHFINRVHSMDDVLMYAERNKWNDILVLGYKDCGRGATYEPENGDMDTEILLDLPKFHGNVMFDNLAVDQLGVRSYVSDSEWKMFFGGHDGEYTMFVDLVNMRFAKSSYSPETFVHDGNIVKEFTRLKELI